MQRSRWTSTEADTVTKKSTKIGDLTHFLVFIEDMEIEDGKFIVTLKPGEDFILIAQRTHTKFSYDEDIELEPEEADY